MALKSDTAAPPGDNVNKGDAPTSEAGDIDPAKSMSEHGKSTSTYETAPSQTSNTSRGPGGFGSARTKISLGKKS